MPSQDEMNEPIQMTPEQKRVRDQLLADYRAAVERLQAEKEQIMSEERQMSKGEQRVRATFNPNGNRLVDEIKANTAALIDRCEALRTEEEFQEERNAERHRLCSLAQTAYEEAAMWAVKAATL